MWRVLLVTGFCILSTAANANNIKKTNTLLFNGFNSPGYGEIAYQSGKLFDYKAAAASLKAGWQLVRIGDWVSATIGAGVVDYSFLTNSMSGGPERLDANYYGPLGELILFPGFRLQVSVSYLSGSGRVRFEETGNSPQLKSDLDVTETSVNVMYGIMDQVQIVLGGSAKTFEAEDMPEPYREDEGQVFFIGLRGTLL